MPRALVIAVVALLAFAACGSDGDDDRVAANAPAAAEHALLTLADFSDGWNASEPVAPLDWHLVPDAECLPYEELQELHPLATAQSPSFHGELYGEVGSSSAVYADEETARRAYDLQVAVLERCGEDRRAEWEQMFHEGFAGDDFVDQLRVLIVEREAPAAGPAIMAHRFLHYGPDNLMLAVDDVLMHEGRIVVAISSSNAQPDEPPHDESLVPILAERLREADEMLDRRP
jgi:hypothetical protein